LSRVLHNNRLYRLNRLSAARDTIAYKRVRVRVDAIVRGGPDARLVVLRRQLTDIGLATVVDMGQFDHIAQAMLASPLMGAFIEMAESNDFSRLESSTAKRHHFLPQLLLRHFATPFRGKDCIFQMEATSRRAPLRVDIRTAASRHRLYAMPDAEGAISNRHEGYLALVESHAAPALRSLLEDPAELSPPDRATIAFFVALQTMRTPAAAQQITELVNAAFRVSASEHFSDRRAFAAGYREYYGDGANDDDIERFRQEVIASVREGRVHLTTPGGGAFSIGLRHAAEQVPMLYEWGGETL
jgi:hypothetical protein